MSAVSVTHTKGKSPSFLSVSRAATYISPETYDIRSWWLTTRTPICLDNWSPSSNDSRNLCFIFWCLEKVLDTLDFKYSRWCVDFSWCWGPVSLQLPPSLFQSLRDSSSIWCIVILCSRIPVFLMPHAFRKFLDAFGRGHRKWKRLHFEFV